jgi:Hint domain-containing protein
MALNDPTLSTTPDQASVTLGDPVTLTDTADLEGGFNPTGTITFTLIGPDGTTVLDTEMVLVNGNGLYSTPHGFTPGVNPGGPDLTGTYQWNAAYSGDDNNNTASDNNDPTEQVTVNADTPTLSTTPSQTDVTLGPPVTLNDTAFLQGGFNPTGTITFTLIGPDGITVVDTETVLVFGNGPYSTPHGFTPGVNPGGPDLTGTYQWNASYSGDDNNNTASDNNDPTEQVTVNADTPTLSTIPNQTNVTLGPPVTLNDTAFLQGGFNPKGTITFTLIGPDGVTVVDTEMVLVFGNGLYSTPHGFTPGVDPGGPDLTGTYQWNASYSGDDNNTDASDIDDSNEQVTVNADTPTLSTIPSQTDVTLGPPVTMNDTAFLQGGFNPTGTITFTLIGPDGVSVVDTETVLVFGNGLYSTPTGFMPTAAGTYQWNAAYSGDDNNKAATDIDDPTEQVTVAPCYCSGTLILTDRGEVPVEDLAIGDKVVTLSGVAQAIRRIGRRAYDGRFIAGNRQVLPIRIAPGAIADGVPARELSVSPNHAMYIDGLLVQAEHLINGVTIAQAEAVEAVEYFHIELDDHDIVFAEGAPAETFVDCDNRLMFRNGAEYSTLYANDERPSWTFCAPRLEWGADELTAIRAELLQRAEQRGLVLDPDLYLEADGEILRSPSETGALCRFVISADTKAVWFVSRRAVPAETVADSRDIRPLGVPVERVVLSDANLSIEAWHGHAALCDGFHDDEPTHRWTDGRARLPEAWLRLFSGDITVELHLFPSELRYPLPAPATAATVRPEVKVKRAAGRRPSSAKRRGAATPATRKRGAVPAAASPRQRKRDRGSPPGLAAVG